MGGRRPVFHVFRRRAGMDMTLAVIAKLCGREKSLEIASRAEYEWHEDSSWDPFAAVVGV